MQVPIAQRALVLEDVIVHLPESALDTGSFRGLGGMLRMWMHLT